MMGKKKILFWEALHYLGGGQKLAVEGAKALRHDFEVIFLVPGTGPLTTELDNLGIHFKTYSYLQLTRGEKGFFDLLKFLYRLPFGFLDAVKQIHRIKPDVIHAYAAPTFICAYLIGKIFRIPIFLHIHNRFKDAKSIWILRKISQSSSIKKIICDSMALEEQFPAVRNKTITIAPGIDGVRFRRQGDNSNIFLKYGMRSHQKIILQIGWIMREKGQHVVLKAFHQLYQKNKDVVLFFIGSVLSGEEEYHSKLLKFVSENQLGNDVFFTGFSSVQPYLKHAAIHVVGSYEGFSIAILEAAAYGVPSVVPNCGGPGVNIEHEKTGLIYELGNENSLCSAMARLLDDERIYFQIKGNLTKYLRQYTEENYRNNISELTKKYSR